MMSSSINDLHDNVIVFTVFKLLKKIFQSVNIYRGVSSVFGQESN